MSASLGNVMMVSADRSVVAGERGPFHYMLETFSEHWDRVDVIGTRPAKIEQTRVFGNVHLHHPTSGKLRQASYIAKTGRALAAERDYTVITSHDYNPFYNGLGSWRISRATGIPYVAEIHHVPGYPRPANLRERVDRPATRAYVRWARSRAAGFRVVNGVELPALLRSWGVPAERIHVLPSLYLDPTLFHPADPRPAPEADLLFVGRLVPNKGVLEIVRALRLLADAGLPGLTLRLVGRGPQLGEIRAEASRLGVGDQLDHIPWVEDAQALADVYRKARVLVCASTSEGGPRVVPEAMACGTPSASTSVGIVSELIEDGVDGVIFDGTAADLARRLAPLLSDAAAEGDVQRRLPPADMSRFDRDVVIEALADGLKRIAADHRARAARTR